MNIAILAAVLFAALAAAAVAWALKERVRASVAEARISLLEGQAEAHAEYLKAQAAQSANAVAEALVKQTEETFRNREQLAQARIEAQLKPVAETLQKFQEQVAAVEKQRAEETGGLKQQISQLLAASTATQDEARKLSAALRRGAGVQGRWGEQTLRNVLEAAGLSKRYDFDEQTSTDTEEGRRRPDVTIRLPGGGLFVIDAKCSLNAFLELQDAADDLARDACGLRHVQSVRGHIQGLSAKAYWDQFESSPDFVAMFVPLDSALAAALDRAPDLLTEAMDRRVVIVTPTTLFALCKAVSYGWRVEDQAANARKIADLGRELYKRIAVMGGHASSVGKALTAAVDRYNQMVASLETQVLTQAKRFEDLKVDHQGKEIAEIAPVEASVRPLVKLHPAEGPQVRLVAGEDA
ncbi:DNA recombination protein RmuC [Phenylobacterium sp.]|jgi:DNA recombination protein RmuC|uniref:DNA recombination protein RmuC n=1 Tax=Phenylobacterium sp. TaxID=1871053 RepID=UPI002F95E181